MQKKFSIQYELKITFPFIFTMYSQNKIFGMLQSPSHMNKIPPNPNPNLPYPHPSRHYPQPPPSCRLAATADESRHRSPLASSSSALLNLRRHHILPLLQWPPHVDLINDLPTALLHPTAEEAPPSPPPPICCCHLLPLNSSVDEP